MLALALTLGVWLTAGYVLTRRIQDTRSRAADIAERYMDAQEVLSTVNAKILLGSVYMRDALMDEAASTPDFHATVEDTFNVIDGLMARYVPVLDTTAERERLARLRLEIEEFKRRMLEVLRAARGSAREARILLRTQVVPKREVVIRMSEEVRALNREAFVRQQGEVAEVYAASQRWFWGVLSLAIIASFGIALGAVRYAGRLEQRLRQQAVAQARNAADLQRLSAKLITTQEEERRTISRDLHDEVGQGLTAIKVELAVADTAIHAAGLSPELLKNARTIADGTLATIRDLSQLLRPPMLDDLGLADALQSYTETFGRRHQVRVDFIHSGLTDRLPPDLETSVYRIVQEALTNVAKHARASACRVTVARRPHAMSITVEDDGLGFDAEAAGVGGLGLVGIRERALQFQGTFDIRRGTKRGTRLTVELPLAPARSTDGGSAERPGRTGTLAEVHE